MIALPWKLRSSSETAAGCLAQRLQVHPVVAELLVARGYDDPERARRLLNPTLNDLLDPGDLPDVDLAVERLSAAIKAEERILVYGDYDVDGITGTAIMLQFLTLVGGDVIYAIPHRREGYGMNRGRLEQAARDGVKVVVSVDTGIAALEEAEIVSRLGMDLVICDHHELAAGGLPKAYARVHPRLGNSSYGNPNLCGAGVAFKVAWAVAQHLSAGRRVRADLRQHLLSAMALVALGTVADVVPLVGENRAMVRFGLRALQATDAHGLRALLRAADLHGDVEASDVAFRIAPRINAAGRIDDAGLAMKLILAKDPEEASRLASVLERLNRRRRDIERGVTAAAREQVLDLEELPAALVVAGQGWHPGVVGIVAARLVEEFGRPAAVVAMEGESGRGSVRTVPGIDVHRALSECSDLMEKFGGHAAAAGLEVTEARLADLGQRFAEAVHKQAEECEPPSLEIDLELKLDQLDRELTDAIKGFGPFGQGHPEPVFCARGVEVVGSPRLMAGRHLQIHVRQGGAALRAVMFGRPDLLEPMVELARGGPGQSRKLDIAFRPVKGRRSGPDSLELHLEDVHLEAR